MAGVTNAGFTKKTIEDIKSGIEQDQLANVDPELNLDGTQPLGQMIASVSRVAAEIWELAEVVYHAFDPDAVEGRGLDNISKLTGVLRDKAQKSTVVQNCTLASGFSAPAGTMTVNAAGDASSQWVNKDDVAPIASPGVYPVVFVNTQYGPLPANAGTLTVITHTMTGWTATTNPLDAELGRLDEEDPSLRQRRVDELTAPGSSTVDAIRTDLLEVHGVQQAFVFENTSLATDGNGVPGKAFESVIYDGAGVDADDDDVAQAIWNSKPSGSETYGATSGTAIDKQGDPQTVNFSRATIEDIYLEIDLVTNTDFPIAGATLVKEALVKRGNAWNLGDDVIALALKAAALTVPGVVDVAALRLGFAASPVNMDNLTITGRQIARFDTSRVVVA